MSERAPRAGAIIGGKYQLVLRLGAGGMGVVWAASELDGGRRVAIKFLKDLDPVDQADAVERLLREARAAASVRHPNVVEIYEVLALEGGAPAIVMELLTGESLRELLLRVKRLSLEQAAQYLLPVASAVAAAHARSIIHRDLKPDNIFLNQVAGGGSVVKVLDFGIAKVTRVDGETTTSLGLTGTGELLGTPNYMSPEQIFGEVDVDQRADIWALGVILYECLTGAVPTQGNNVGQVLKTVLSGKMRPLRTILPDAPADVLDLIDSMLALNREQRPYDLRAIIDVLGRHCDLSVPSFRRPQVRADSSGDYDSTAVTERRVAAGNSDDGGPAGDAQRPLTTTRSPLAGSLPSPKGRTVGLTVGLVLALVCLTLLPGSLARSRGSAAPTAIVQPRSPDVMPPPDSRGDADQLPLPQAGSDSNRAVSATSASATPPLPPRKPSVQPRPRQSVSTSAAKSRPSAPSVDCSPPYEVDPISGIKRFKPACVLGKRP